MRSDRKPQRLALLFSAALAIGHAGHSLAADPNSPAEAVVTARVVRPAEKVPPLGANGYGRCGAVEWARNNFVHNAGNEPIYWRNLHRVMQCGPNWIEFDGPGTSWYDLWGNGFLSGAEVRVYRLVDKNGQPLPLTKEGNLSDTSQADHVVLVGKSAVIAEGSPDFPDGGWVVTKYGDVFPNSNIGAANLSVTDYNAVENGREYWYTVVAVDAKGAESDFAAEVRAAPQAGVDTPPHICIVGQKDEIAVPASQPCSFQPKAFGGVAPLTWSVVDVAGKPAELPAGLKIDLATGVISGKASAAPAEGTLVRLKVADAKGRSDVRAYVANASKSKPTASGKLQPPQALSAVAGDGCVTVSWKASPSDGVVNYRLKRSMRPLAKQENRVYLVQGGPSVQRFDYIVVQRKFDPFDMKVVHPRVRGIGNPANSPSWHWQADLARVQLSLVAHPKPVPAEMLEPGDTCLQAKALVAGESSINQIVMIGTEHGGESIWYGQLEPGKNYHLEVWLRQAGLASDGAVTFTYAPGYPDIKKTFNVTGEWRKYAFDFTGPERPKQPMHFGHKFVFTGPGTLWMDNCRISRVDSPDDLKQPYVPNATVFNELIASHPAEGPKGPQRCWVLTRDMTMKSLLSWHSNSQVRPDWSTSVSGTEEMTLPAALELSRRTGDKPATRVVPWITIQHILHNEADWQAFIEYLAAPYNPTSDSAKTKPWAFMRYQQRGVGAPWTDEFREVVVEFGNETWHNGVFDDWLGFATRNAVWQGGREYGIFCRYLIDNIQKSPYWTPALGKKIRFALNDGYIRRNIDGRELTYGEEAMLACPQATILAHANYVGPKWETGDKSSGAFDDHGVQATLLAYLTGNEIDSRKSQAVRDEIAKAGHDYDLAAYESGPSGYTLPGSAGPAVVEVNEKYGKSLAMGVAALDAWLGAYERGWTYQSFLGYGQGQYWNSHTWFSAGFRPCPGWQALQLRNRFARGEMVAVETPRMPTIQFGKAVYPLIGIYAMRDRDRWSVFVLSRKLDGNHDGVDFRDGQTPVTLKLPFAACRKLAVHKLAGDPRLSNRDKLNFEIKSQELAASAVRQGTLSINEQTGGSKNGIPPGSIYLYVFEGATER